MTTKWKSVLHPSGHYGLQGTRVRENVRTVRDELLEREVQRVMRIENKARRDSAFTNPDPMYGGDRSYEPMPNGGRRSPVRYE